MSFQESRKDGITANELTVCKKAEGGHLVASDLKVHGR